MLSLLAAAVAGWTAKVNATVAGIGDERDDRLGWTDDATQRWRELGSPSAAGRVSRLDRGWSTVLVSLDQPPLRMRNIGADVAVGDFVVVTDDGERVEEVLPRRSAFVRRASFEGNRAEAHTIAANIDVVMLLHALTSPPNQRRLERELVLAWDSGARPVVVLTKIDLVDDASVDGRGAAGRGAGRRRAGGEWHHRRGRRRAASLRRRERHHCAARCQRGGQEHAR